MALNVFSLLFGFAALLANSLAKVEPEALDSNQQVHLETPELLLMVDEMWGYYKTMTCWCDSLPSATFLLYVISELVPMLWRRATLCSPLCVSWEPSTFCSCAGEACAATVLIIWRPTPVSHRYMLVIETFNMKYLLTVEHRHFHTLYKLFLSTSDRMSLSLKL